MPTSFPNQKGNIIGRLSLRSMYELALSSRGTAEQGPAEHSAHKLHASLFHTPIRVHSPKPDTIFKEFQSFFAAAPRCKRGMRLLLVTGNHANAGDRGEGIGSGVYNLGTLALNVTLIKHNHVTTRNDDVFR